MEKLFKTGDWYHYARLPEHEKRMYMTIYNNLKKEAEDFTFRAERHNGVLPSWNRVLELFLHVIWDNPVLYQVDATNIGLAYDPLRSDIVRFSCTDHFPDDLEEAVEQTLRMRVDQILDMLHGQPKGYWQLRKLYDYMVESIDYMDDVSKVNNLKNLEARTVTGPLLSHLGVCAGYAKAFKLVCDQLGIGCFYLRGKGFGNGAWGNHGWNVVYLEGAFYHVDVTFERGRYESTGKNDHRYFLRGDAAMDDDHRWDRQRFPAMTDYER